MTQDILYLFSNGVRVYVLYRFFGLFLGKKRISSKAVSLVYAAFYCCNSGLHLLFGNPIFNLALNIGGCLIITAFYWDKAAKKVMVVLAGYSIQMITETVSYYLLIFFAEPDTVKTALSVIPVFWDYLVVLVLEKATGRKRKNNHGRIMWSCIFFLPLGSISILALCFLYITATAVNAAVAAVLFGMNLVTFYLLDQMERYYEAKNRTERLEAQNRAYLNQIEILQQSERKIKAFRHDWKNHLYRIQSMIHDTQEEELKLYLEHACRSMEDERKLANTGNKGIDSIVNYKLNRAAELNVRLDLQLKIPEKLDISDFDLTVILGNLLDNALEELEKCSLRELKLYLWLEKGVLFLELENTYRGILLEHNGEYRTTKEKPGEHGIGLQNVKSIVEKYAGDYSVSHNNKCFKVNIILMNQKCEPEAMP